jgi:hypothetical protein
MTDSTPSPAPYQSPPSFGDADVPDSETLPRRPGGLTAICVIAIILGGLGVITGLMGIGGLLGGQAIQKNLAPSFPQPAGAPIGETHEKMMEVQGEMNDKIYAVGRQFILPNAIVLTLHVAVAVFLIVGAVQCLKLKAVGRTILIATFCFAIPFEMARSGFQLYQQMQIMAVMEVYFPRMMEAATPPDAPEAPDMGAMMNVMMSAMKAASYGMIIVFLLVKGIFYAIGAMYMTRRKVRELFERAAARPSPIDAALAGD